MKQFRDQLNTRLRERLPSLARHLYPDGKKVGGSWRVGSFDINIHSGFWGDFDGSTESMSRNLIDLWIYATGCTFKTAIEEITAWLGLPQNQLETITSIRIAPTPDPERKLLLPLLEKPTRNELRILSTLRSIPVEALQIAVRQNFLWCYTDRREQVRAWLITDSARKSAVGRRLDGLPWKSIGGKKSKTLYGSWGHWPIGLPEAEPYPAIGLVEGAPDFLALIAHTLINAVPSGVATVCMSGAEMTIPESALPRFRDKPIQIYVHADNAGIIAATRWRDQLRKVASAVHTYTFNGFIQDNGQPVEDLNDLLCLDPGCRAAHSDALKQLLDFV
jgi:hypothetical protein